MKNFNNKYRDILSEIKIFEDAMAEVENTESKVGSALREELISLKLAKQLFEKNAK